MHAYRSHTCGELAEANVGQSVRLSGWINRKRDHGQLVFVDLRDHYGLTQCVVDSSDPSFAAVEATRLESVVTITGTVLNVPSKINKCLARVTMSATAQTKGSHGYRTTV